MSALLLTAHLHERTVQAVARDEISLPRPRRRPTKQPRTITTRQVRVESRVMKVARELAGGDCRRILIIDDQTVVVFNHPIKREERQWLRRSQ